MGGRAVGVRALIQGNVRSEGIAAYYPNNPSLNDSLDDFAVVPHGDNNFAIAIQGNICPLTRRASNHFNRLPLNFEGSK